jgi:hypothetical protein
MATTQNLLFPFHESLVACGLKQTSHERGYGAEYSHIVANDFSGNPFAWIFAQLGPAWSQYGTLLG